MELEAKLYAIHDDSLIEVANNFLITLNNLILLITTPSGR